MAQYTFPATYNTQPDEDMLHYFGTDSISSHDSSDSSTILAPRQAIREEPPQRCWICFGDTTDSQGPWVKPCPCSLEAHQSCLLDWIAENQKGSVAKKVKCPQCGTTYHLSQHNTVRLAFMALIDALIRASAPYVTVLGVSYSVWITCTTYGAFSVMMLFGFKDGEQLIGYPANWTWKNWVGLPMIPVVLFSTKTRWGDIILSMATYNLLRSSGNDTFDHLKLSWPMSPALTIALFPGIRMFYRKVYRFLQSQLYRSLTLQDASLLSSNQKNRVPVSERERNLERDMLQGTSHGDIGLSMMSTLLWPVVSGMIGGLLNRFKWIHMHFPSTIQRNILGGCLFVIVKDMGNLWYKYERIKQYRSRQVINYKDTKK